MGTPYLSEIKIIAFDFAPKGWALCNGQLLQINQNQALFALLGTTYGGNGQTTFALPDLRGRVPVHVGLGLTLGQRAGETAHTLIMGEMPAHNHPVIAVTDQATTNDPTDNGANDGMLASIADNFYFQGNPTTTLFAGTISNVGGSQPHQNQQPYTVLNMIIALQGAFPSRN